MAGAPGDGPAWFKSADCVSVEGTVIVAKRAMRDAMRRRLVLLSAEERAVESARICRRLVELPGWKGDGVLLGFAGMETEPDILPALREAAGHREVALPRWDPVHLRYEAARLISGAGLAIGRYGVLEPASGEATIPFERLDLILVPGLAFDRCGRRLGRGKGYFDRLLASAPQARRWGVAFDMQIVMEVPTSAHDVNLHLLVTPDSCVAVSPGESV